MLYSDFINFSIIKNYWEKDENIIHFLRFICYKYKIEKVEDWYTINKSILSKEGSYKIFSRFKTITKLLNHIYKENYKFLEWNFDKIPKGYFSNLENQIQYFEWLFKELNYKKLEDYYNLTNEKLINKKGSWFMHNYINIISILKTIYPKYKWLPWKFIQVPHGYWEDINNQKEYMDWLFKELKYETMEDWYKLTNEDLIKNGGGYLVKFGNINNLKNVYPEYKWLPWKFIQVPSGYWEDINNQKEYMDWLFKELKYETMEDWYKLTRFVITDYYGLTLFIKNKCSAYYLLQSVYPKVNWIPWKFKKITANFWEDIDNQKEYMDWLFKELKYETMEDWYKLTNEILYKYEGDKILRKYSSLKHLLKTIYPEFNWLPWNFINVQTGYWDDINNQIYFMDWLFKELKYETMEDWYNVTIENIRFYSASGFTRKYNESVINILKNIYPEFDWKEEKFSRFKGEGNCYSFLKKNYKTIWGYRTNWCKSEISNKYLPFDFCIEELKVLIEVDGKQHFIQVSNWDSPEKTRKRDKYKMEKALENGYSVIRILWDDIYYDKNDWNIILKDAIDSIKNPKIIFIGEEYKKYEEYKGFL